MIKIIGEIIRSIQYYGWKSRSFKIVQGTKWTNLKLAVDREEDVGYGKQLGKNRGASLVPQTVKESAYNTADQGLCPELGSSPGEGNGNPFQYSCLANSMEKAAWRGYSPWDHKQLDMTAGLNWTEETEGLLWWLGSKESACSVGAAGEEVSIPGSGGCPGRGHDDSFQLFLPEESHGQRNLAGYSP